jgi:hypothetical protein
MSASQRLLNGPFNATNAMSLENISSEQLRLTELFFPFAFRKVLEVNEKKTRFVHYTNADAALSILRNREVWLRQSTVMVDYLEVEYGLQRVVEAYDGEPGEKLKSTLEAVVPGFVKRFEDHMNAWAPHIR